jgi:hypothetical protein
MLDANRRPAAQSPETQPPSQGEIDVASLTTCAVSSDGSQVRLNFEDALGRPAQLKLTSTDVQKLLMTLPQLLSRALQAQHKDAAVRAVFPLRRWRIETATAAEDLILTLTTPDGFEVSFSLSKSTIAEIAAALEETVALVEQGATRRAS